MKGGELQGFQLTPIEIVDYGSVSVPLNESSSNEMAKYCKSHKSEGEEIQNVWELSFPSIKLNDE